MRTDTCFYFNGLQNQCCQAGVNYRELTGVKTGPMADRLPCFQNSEHTTCTLFRFPTKQEMDEFEAQIQERLNMFMKAAPLIAELKREYKGREGKVVKTCPVCGGRLHMSIASYNGHVWGKCETQGCLSWME